jgi:hypothetical protein
MFEERSLPHQTLFWQEKSDTKSRPDSLLTEKRENQCGADSRHRGEIYRYSGLWVFCLVKCGFGKRNLTPKIEIGFSTDREACESIPQKKVEPSVDAQMGRKLGAGLHRSD